MTCCSCTSWRRPHSATFLLYDQSSRASYECSCITSRAIKDRRLVISVIYSSVIDHDPPTQICRYYGPILTFDNYGHLLTVDKTRSTGPSPSCIHAEINYFITMSQSTAIIDGHMLKHSLKKKLDLCVDAI